MTLCGCASNGLPITSLTPSVTLPPAEVNFIAPIGDASLTHTKDAVLYLPSRDGISLTQVQTQVAFSPVRPDAETLVRALLAHTGTKNASALGRGTKLSLYGTTPVEVSRNVVTVNLSASALQLDRESLYVACQAIANTLCELDGIEYVNVLVVNKPVGLDIANTLPMGALKYSTAQDLGAVYQQLLSRRTTGDEHIMNEPFSANVTLYFPLNGTDGMVSEVRAMSFENQVLSDMVKAILRELAAGPHDSQISSPALPLLADLLNATPTLSDASEAGGSILSLDFAHNLEDMLEAYGISQRQNLASLCYTLTTFFPNVTGVRLSISGTPVDELLKSEPSDEVGSLHLRTDHSDALMDYCTLYFASEDQGSLVASQRPIPYRRCHDPRALLCELSKGPQASDSSPELLPVMPQGAITDTDLLGFALDGSTLLVNLAPTFETACKGIGADEERMLAYAMVNTLCEDALIQSVCFFRSGSQFDGFSGEIYWAGLFYPLPQ